MCTILFVVVTPHIHRYILLLIHKQGWHHRTVLGHIYDFTTFQTIVMSEVAW